MAWTIRYGRGPGAIPAVALALTACAGPQVAPLTATAPPIAAPVPRPPAPAGLSEALAVPLRAPDGGYLTINHGVAGDRALWHVRSALNVAALSCRGVREAAMVAGYNALLGDRRAMLAAAHRAVTAEFRADGGSDATAAQDRYMTRLYNFFALPLAQAAFCAAAADVMAEGAALDPAAYRAFAPLALARLEAPFLDVFRRTDDFRTRLAAWQAGTSPTAAASPAAPRIAYADLGAVIAWMPDKPAGATRLLLTAR